MNDQLRYNCLQEIMQFVDMYSLEDNEFYVDRDPGAFNCILNYHRAVVYGSFEGKYKL